MADAIKDRVVAERLRPGNRLPGEAALIARFGMAKTPSARPSASSRRRASWRPATGPGGGSFVGEITGERARALLANFFFRDLTVGDVHALRLLLVPEVAASLAGRLAEADLAELEAITRA